MGWETAVMPPKQTKRAKGTVGEGAAGKKAKATQHAGGQCVSEKSQATRTSKNVFEKSNSKTQYLVREVKGRRMMKNGVEFLIGWHDFPLDKDDTWEPITNLPGSEHMIAEFQRNWEEQYKIKTSEQLHTPTHTHTYHCVIDTLVIVTDTHKHIDRVLCTYMTSYLPQAYRLSILIDKQALSINSWLIRLSVDNVLLINTPKVINSY